MVDCFQIFLGSILREVYSCFRPVIIDMIDKKPNNNSKSSKNVIEWNVLWDDRKPHFATFCNKQKIII